MKLFRGDKEKDVQDFENYDEQDYDWDDEELTEEDYDPDEDSDPEYRYYESEEYVEESEYDEREEYADEDAEYDEQEEYVDEDAEYYGQEEYADEDAEYYRQEEYADEDAEYYGQEEYADEESEYYESEAYTDDIDTYEEAEESVKDAAGYYETAAYDAQNAGYAAEGYTEERTEYYEADAYGESEADYPEQEERFPEKESFFVKIGNVFRGMDTMDKVMVATGLIVLVLAIITGGAFLSSRIVEQQVADFADVGKQLDGITLIGERGLLAVADAEQARLAAATVVAEEEEPPKEYDETGYDRQVTVALNFTSIQKDLKIKFINTKTDKLVPNVPFSVTVTDPNGKTYIWSDDDMDGIIYKKDIPPGDYQIAMEALTDSKYSDYIVSTNTQSAEVKKEIAYKKVDVSNEVKQESEVNAAKEDTKKNETAVESSLQDTVTWVESKVIAASYNEVSKSTIPDPATIAAGRFLRMQESKITFVSQDVTPAPNPVDPSTSTEEPTTEPTPEPTEEPTPEPTATPTAEPTQTPTAAPTPAPTPTPTAAPTPTPTAAPTPTPEPSATPSPSPSPSPTVSPTPLPIGISLDRLTMDVLTNTPATVNATITGAVNTDPAVTAESSDTNVAYVSVDRRTVTVTGVAEGSAVITVKYTENNQTVTATCTVTVKKHPKEDNVTLLKDANGQQIYVQENNTYREATRADYYTASNFFVKGSAKYTGWQTIDGHVYFFTADGNKVTGEQVIQGAKYNFASDGALVVGSGAVGIDVSKWNGTIDWNAVKNSGISYVIIRCGYRGSSAGTLIEDPKFQANIKGATAAGLKVGVYFFTQAVDEIEAVEEASMVLDLVKNYKISYPIFLDVEASGGRADKIDKATRTAVCKAFCQTIQNANYTAGIYANKTWLTSKIDASSLSAYKIWLAQYAASPSYTGRYDLWQYRSTGSVSGISGNVDMNISYLGY